MTGPESSRWITSGLLLLLVFWIGGCGELHASAPIAPAVSPPIRSPADYWISRTGDEPGTITVRYDKEGDRQDTTADGKPFDRAQAETVRAIRVMLSADVSVDVSMLLVDYRHLQHATFGIDTDMASEPVPGLSEFLRWPDVRNLQSLRIEKARVGPDVMLQLSQLPKLTELSLVDCVLDRCCLSAFRLLQLRRLRLNHVEIESREYGDGEPREIVEPPATPGGGSAILGLSPMIQHQWPNSDQLLAIGPLVELEELDIGDAHIDQRWCREIGRYYPKLQALDASGVWLSQGDDLAILGRSQSHLHYLKLNVERGCTLYDEDIVGLKNLVQLRYLHLYPARDKGYYQLKELGQARPNLEMQWCDSPNEP